MGTYASMWYNINISGYEKGVGRGDNRLADPCPKTTNTLGDVSQNTFRFPLT